MGDIRFRDKKGNVKYVAKDDGRMLQIGKKGDVKNIVKHEDTGKEEKVVIEQKDFKITNG